MNPITARLLSVIVRKLPKKLVHIRQQINEVIELFDGSREERGRTQNTSLVEKVLQIYIEIHQTPVNLGNKLYEVVNYMLISVLQGATAENVKNVLQDSYKATELPEINMWQRQSQYVVQHNITYVAAVFYHLTVLKLTHNFKQSQDSYRSFKALITAQFQLLYTRKPDSGEVQFTTDAPCTEQSKKDFGQFQDDMRQTVRFGYDTNVANKQSAHIYSQLLCESTGCSSFIVENLVGQLAYIFDQCSAQQADHSLQFVYLEAARQELAEHFGRAPAALLEQLFTGLAEGAKRLIRQPLLVGDVRFQKFVLLLTALAFRSALCAGNIRVYKTAAALVRQAHLNVVLHEELRDALYDLLESFVCNQRVGGAFLVQQVQLLGALLAPGSSDQLVNVYLSLYDLRPGQRPLGCLVLRFLLAQLRAPRALPTRVVFMQNGTDFGQCALERSGAPERAATARRRVEFRTSGELAMLLLLRLLRCYRRADVERRHCAAAARRFAFLGCCEQFNKADDALVGLRVFQDRGFLGKTVTGVARFLLDNEALLSKERVGELLASPGGECSAILAEYAELVFRERVRPAESPAAQFMGALRSFFAAFRVPGEAQCIDRVLRQFSAHYAIFGNMHQESAYILSYAAMMLNTDIHNVCVADKMTPGQFVANTKHADKHGQFSDHFLRQLYQEIAENPLTLDEVEEARAIGLQGENGLFIYCEQRLFDRLLHQFKVSQLCDFSAETSTEVTSDTYDSSHAWQNTNMSEQLAVVLTPPPFKKVMANVQNSQDDTSKDDYPASSKLSGQHISQVAAQDTNNQEKSERRYDEEDSVQDPMAATQNSTVRLFSAEKSYETGVIDIIQRQNEVQRASSYLLDYFIQPLQDAVMQYIEGTYLKNNRCQIVHELIIHLYRLAGINVNGQHFRSRILYALSLNQHLLLQQFCPTSQLILRYSRVKQGLILQNTNFHPGDMEVLAATAASDLNLALLLATLVSGCVDSISLKVLLCAYMNTLTVLSLRQIMFKECDGPQMLQECDLESAGLQQVEEYSGYLSCLETTFYELQSVYDELRPGYSIRTGAVLELLPPVKATAALLELLEYYLVDGERINHVLGVAGKVVIPVQYGVLGVLQKITTALLSAVSAFDAVSHRFGDAPEGELSERGTTGAQEAAMWIGKSPESEAVFNFALTVFDQVAGTLLAILCHSTVYAAGTALPVAIAQQLSGVALKLLSAVTPLEVPDAVSRAASHTAIAFAHAPLSINCPQALKILTDAISQILGRCTAMVRLQDILPFVTNVLARALMPTTKRCTQHSCTAVHGATDYNRCCIRAECHFAQLLALQSAAQHTPAGAPFLTCVNTIAGLINALLGHLDALDPTDMPSFFAQIVNILVIHTDAQVLGVCFRVLKQVVSRMVELGTIDLKMTAIEISSALVISNLINKSPLKADVLSGSLSLLVEIIGAVVQADDHPIYGSPDAKRDFVDCIFDSCIKKIIQVQRQDGSLYMLEQFIRLAVTCKLPAVFEGVLPKVLVLSEQLYFQTRLMGLEDTQMLLFNQLKQVFIYVSDKQHFYQLAFRFLQSVITNLTRHEQAQLDGGEQLKSIFDGGVENSSDAYLLQIYKFIYTICYVGESFTDEFKVDCLRLIYDSLIDTQIKAKTYQCSNIEQLMETCQYLSQQGMVCCFNEVGFDIELIVMDVLIGYCNRYNHGSYLGTVKQSLAVAERIIIDYSRDDEKICSTFAKLIQYIEFDDREVRVALQSAFNAYQKEVVAERCPRQRDTV